MERRRVVSVKFSMWEFRKMHLSIWKTRAYGADMTRIGHIKTKARGERRGFSAALLLLSRL